MNYTSVIIAGPTASGKSDFAHRLAGRIQGTIINCDSVQIYRHIENISASPGAGRPVGAAIDGVPYRLFSVLSLDEQIGVADYLRRATDEYRAAIAAGRRPIFVGGTGFYIDAIVRGLSPMPDITPDVRRRARALVHDDVASARRLLGDGAPRDPQRMARAVEVLLQTGKPIAAWQSAPRVGGIRPTPLRVLINPDRDTLCDRIVARIPQMMAGGAMAEAQRIIDNGWDENRAIGAVQLCRYLRGEIDQDTAIQNWITATRQYAKRQRTWFKTQYAPDMVFADGDEKNIAAVAAMLNV
ncbi:tRNA (adenosine(37)-N6)-dimethylallyltransferase MiaA [bacterium]|nr:tRNA (adenosine(37)-N6)-dimethylallyltransferase MiaA [bacterium]